ncbi:MAG: arsenosugar biosynthesis radical SAM protein ArsS [Burkholderiales bacterium]|nr:arsenosugar biosynthesis radical SAM protein ArsS [Burkholderiales bacterium]
MHSTLARLATGDFPALVRKRLDTLQVNLGYRCNQACLHCHVNAGPTRTEMMSEQTLDTVLAFLQATRLPTLDVTGGAPELHPGFGRLVSAARALGVRVIDRCNLTVLEQPGQENLARFLASLQVEITASLPCYLERNVDAQRGAGVFAASIRALRRLNALGYGRSDGPLVLNLVFNPQGPALPPAQGELETAYRNTLRDRYGVEFTRLLTLANMPIQRFGSTLVSKRQFDPYMRLLRASFRAQNLETVMCRSLISVDWQGFVYDCDFNQMLAVPLAYGPKPRVRLADLIGTDLTGNPIAVLDHCFGCTAGQGSSCGGALTN